MIPSPAFAEVLIGEENGPDESDIDGAWQALAWAEVYTIDEQTAVTTAEISDEIVPQGPSHGNGRRNRSGRSRTRRPGRFSGFRPHTRRREQLLKSKNID